MTTRPLDGVRVVTIALNLPGPAAARRLLGLGASVIKVEPPSGDPMAAYHPAWYATMSMGQEVCRIDLKTGAGREALDPLLAGAEVLLTSSRISALQRLGLDWDSVRSRHPRLSQVAITGYPRSDRTGHDLTYIAAEGLVVPPAMPRTLIADLAGAERAVSAVLALLLSRERGGGPGYMEVSLAEVAHDLAEPLRVGVTAPGALLGGGFPGYALYRVSDGWIAVAALEPHFLRALEQEAGVTAEEMAATFAKHPASHWEKRGVELDIPMVAVRSQE
ncbi:MAG TPA: CaiB/BaiF CoA-transferase family protein [Gemmatimonadales bacterium]|nr:CaiB/BaiF CoA-transferase family protein [Gemmatimonadales bacterium]